MNVTSNIINGQLLEQVITGYLEDQVCIPGFELLGVVRESNLLTWKFSSEFYHQTVSLWVGYWKAVELIFPDINFEEGDQLNLTYCLKWWWYGGGEVSLEPSPDASLWFELCLVV